MTITYATPNELAYLVEHDRHLSAAVLREKIECREVLIAWEGEQPVGWLRFNYFWDEIPFMNMLFVEEPYRGRGYGRELIGFWETEMRKKGFARVMTSTMSDENAQHLYRRLGYQDCGALRMPGEALEIILMK